jgi:hypothetical protein
MRISSTVLAHYASNKYCCYVRAAACSITELQDQFGIAHDTTAHQLPHMAASVAVMAVPGLMAWAADTSMRLAYNSGPLKAAARTAITGSLQMAGATAASVTSIASLSGPLVPFINLSYGYLPLVRGGAGGSAHGLAQMFQGQRGHTSAVYAWDASLW